jgi:hypothetical protein
MGRQNRDPLVLTENPNWNQTDEYEEVEVDDEESFDPPDAPRDRPGKGDPDGGAGSAPAAVCNLGATGEWKGWPYAELNLDTGAAITAVPLDFVKDYPRNEANGA